MTDTTAPDWVAWEAGKWLVGTSEMDMVTEFVFFRLCMFVYEKGVSTIKASDRRNANRCKVSVEDFKYAIEMLEELEKITVSEDGIYISSCEKRLNDTRSRIEARRIGAAKARRKRELKSLGKTAFQIDQIIKDEFPDIPSDHQSGNQSDDQAPNITEQDSTEHPPKGGEYEGGDLFNGTDLALPEEPKPPSFDQFWETVPSKEGKKKSQSNWSKLTVEEKIAAVANSKAWFADWRKKYPQASWIMPQRYLSERRWEDEGFKGLTVTVADREAQIKSLVEWIKGPKSCPPSLLSNAQREYLLSKGLVTEVELKAKGL